MLSLSHTLISLPLALLFDNIVIIFLAALIWHIFCDTLLHWNIYPPAWRRYPAGWVALDIISGLAIAWLLLRGQLFSPPVLAAIAGGNMPDIIHGLWNMLPPRSKKTAPRFIRAAFSFHDKSQFETNNIPLGLISQLVLIAASVAVVVYSF